MSPAPYAPSPPTSIQETVARCLALIPLIREHQGISLDELSRLSRIPKEQIADELGSVLLMCGVPPYFPHDYIGFILEGDRVHIRFADHFRRPVSLNPLEALALKLACESIAPPGKAIPRAVANLLRKVEQAMSAEQRRQFLNLARRLIVREAADPPAGLTGRMAMAVAERRAIRLDYCASGRDAGKEREVHPYGLFTRDGHWYLAGFDLSRGVVATFRLDRARQVQVLDDRFEIDPAFRLEDAVRGAQGPEGDDRPRARIRFQGVAARWIRETAQPGTVAEEGATVVWTPVIGSEAGLARFVLGFGEDAEVLAPESLRHHHRGALESVLAAHAN